MSIKEVLRLADNLGLPVSLVESDASNAMWEINGNFSFSPRALIINEIKSLFQLVSGGPCHLILWSANGVTHSLATSISMYSKDMMWADCCPLFKSSTIIEDLN